jgi:hypothetical protein
MATYFRRPSDNLGAVGTTRLIIITTAAAQQVFLSTGFTGINVMNNGPATCSWGDSSIAQGSGAVLFPYAQYEWLKLNDGWSTYFRADSAQTTIAITEFR